MKCSAGVMISAMDTLLIIVFFAQTHLAHSLWTCSENTDCSSLSGSVCVSGECVCVAGQQAVQGGSVCVNAAPYYTSPCVEDFQCSRLLSGFHCRKNGNSTEGNCMCQSGHHYIRGRCWRSKDFGESCSRDEECAGVPDPFSVKCDTTCQCSNEYFERQKGHCRKAAKEGESCVINQDCRFEDGTCDKNAFICTNGAESENKDSPFQNVEKQTHNKISRVPCDSANPCKNPFVCSNLGVCICPSGYYESDVDSSCLAELGSPSTPEQCVGFLAEVVNGICTCRNNFFFDENMRDCVKATRTFSDSCTSDVMCETFGPSQCGPAAAPWGLRQCECRGSMWDPLLNVCRYFAVIGERCEVDGDCLAGEQEIQCVKNQAGEGYCACPQGLLEHEGLCLDSGLKLEEDCQHDLECTGTANTGCVAGVCSCSEGYQKQNGSDNTEPICAPKIGGSCVLDSDCVIDNTYCKSDNNSLTCQCMDSFVDYDDVCWPRSSGYNASCSVSAQCPFASARCEARRCACERGRHYRDDACWTVTGLFSPCARTSECYLSEGSERTVCRNSVCQCDFDYTYSDIWQTCSSATTNHFAAILFVITAAVHTLFYRQYYII